MSTHRRWRVWAAAVILGLAPNVNAQGIALTGRVELLERKGVAKDVDESVIWLEGPGLGGGTARRAEISTEDKAFSPRITVVPVGSIIALPNHDPFDHNVFSSSGPRLFDLGLYGRNETRTVTFDKPGIAKLYCNVHARMSAIVVVHATQFAARADRAGRFSIDGVPPGKYTLHVWHERGGEREQPVTVPLAAELVVSLDTRSWKFTQHLDKNGKSYDARGRRY